MKQAVETRRMIEREGIECPLVTGGSTGTFLIDSEIDGVTEIQPGSFAFMDAGILRHRWAGGRRVPRVRARRSRSWRPSSRGDRAWRSSTQATRRSPPIGRSHPTPIGLPGVTYGWAGDEHGRLDLTQSDCDLRVGNRVEFVPPHCDPTVNLYDVIHALRGDTIEAIWPIAARGKSQ